MMSSEKKVKVTVEACGEVRSFECRCATVSIGNGDGTGNACFVGSASLGGLFALTCECINVLCAAFSQAGVWTATRASSCSWPRSMPTPTGTPTASRPSTWTRAGRSATWRRSWASMPTSSERRAVVQRGADRALVRPPLHGHRPRDRKADQAVQVVGRGADARAGAGRVRQVGGDVDPSSAWTAPSACPRCSRRTSRTPSTACQTTRWRRTAAWSGRWWSRPSGGFPTTSLSRGTCRRRTACCLRPGRARGCRPRRCSRCTRCSRAPTARGDRRWACASTLTCPRPRPTPWSPSRFPSSTP